MCVKCDNPEGNMCNKCEQELADVKHQALYDDGWWPQVVVGRRSITAASMSNDQPAVLEYV